MIIGLMDRVGQDKNQNIHEQYAGRSYMCARGRGAGVFVSYFIIIVAPLACFKDGSIDDVDNDNEKMICL